MHSPASLLITLIMAILHTRDFVTSTPSIAYAREGDELPHCSNNVLMESQLGEVKDGGGGEDYRDETAAVNLTSTAQFYMSLGETTCLLMKSNRTFYGGLAVTFSMLHTIDFLRLEHHYAVAGKYRFGIPLIRQQCKCDCAGGDSICPIDAYHYRNCSTGALCYRTYQPSQSSAGCMMSSSKSELCCQIQIDPYREWTFEALKLRQPDTVLVLRYRIFERNQEGGGKGSRSRRYDRKVRWKSSVDEVIEIPFNRGVSKFALNRENLIQLVAGSGRPHRQMEPGLYFRQLFNPTATEGGSSGADQLRGGVALNDLRESTLEKLGWFRHEDGRWQVRKGLVKLTQAQHVTVHDCKAQHYTSAFNAEQYVLRSWDGGGGEGEQDVVLNYDLGHLVNDEAWVAGVEIGERVVKVEHAEGSDLMLTVRTQTTPRVVHHASHLSGFNGTIQQDADSNRYMNLSFYDASGTLVGQVYSSDSRTAMEMVFSVETSSAAAASRSRHPTSPPFKSIIAVPASIQSKRLVCVHPAGDFEGQMCHWLDYVDSPLREYRIGSDRWQHGHSECQGCNERGMESLLASLDPRMWLNGLNTPTELFICVLEVVLCLCLILLTVITCTKCVIPMARCLRSIAKPPKKK